jgi:hypothetical protein
MKLQPILLALSFVALGACRPTPPPTEQPPEPTASTDVADSADAAGEPKATQMRDAIQAPLNKARAVQDTVQEAADKQRAEIDAATAQ